jgi:prephenate dehydratase
MVSNEPPPTLQFLTIKLHLAAPRRGALSVVVSAIHAQNTCRQVLRYLSAMVTPSNRTTDSSSAELVADIVPDSVGICTRPSRIT